MRALCCVTHGRTSPPALLTLASPSTQNLRPPPPATFIRMLLLLVPSGREIDCDTALPSPMIMDKILRYLAHSVGFSSRRPLHSAPCFGATCTACAAVLPRSDRRPCLSSLARARVPLAAGRSEEPVARCVAGRQRRCARRGDERRRRTSGAALKTAADESAGGGVDEAGDIEQASGGSHRRQAARRLSRQPRHARVGSETRVSVRVSCERQRVLCGIACA